MNPAQAILAKVTLPTALDSEGFRAKYGAAIHKQALTSARATSDAFLKDFQKALAALARGEINTADARGRLMDSLDSLGYTPSGGFPGGETVPSAPGGSLRDLSSFRRLNLMLETNLATADSLAQMAVVEDPGILDDYPAFELIPGGYRARPRADWPERWRAAFDACGGEGAHPTEMIARVDSPIWAALGEGAGGFRDTLGNPFPPFAWGSSHIWVNVSRAEAEALGIVEKEAGRG